MKFDDILDSRVDQTLQRIKNTTNFIHQFYHYHGSKTLVWNLWYGPTQHRDTVVSSSHDSQLTPGLIVSFANH